jgi:hypothetical protein
MQKKFKLSSDGGTYGGLWWSLHSAGVWSLEVNFVLVYLAGIWIQFP